MAPSRAIVAGIVTGDAADNRALQAAFGVGRIRGQRKAGDGEQGEAILSAPDRRVQAFLAAGHVCAVMGYEEYVPIAAKNHGVHRGHRI